jgi:hypothetical protein
MTHTVSLALEGELETNLSDGGRYLLKRGLSYQVADDAEAQTACWQLCSEAGVW